MEPEVPTVGEARGFEVFFAAEHLRLVRRVHDGAHSLPYRGSAEMGRLLWTTPEK